MRLAILATAGLAVLAGPIVPPVAAPTPQTAVVQLQPTSVANGAISRQEMLLRSASWIRDRVPYSQDNGSPHVNKFGSYRRDCSGFVSMAWHLSSSLSTAASRVGLS